MILESVIHEWQAFRRGLRSADRQAFDKMMTRARRHAGAASNAARLNPTEALFMAILVEHERVLQELEKMQKLQKLQKEQVIQNNSIIKDPELDNSSETISTPE
jgi:hypothetical protein